MSDDTQDLQDLFSTTGMDDDALAALGATVDTLGANLTAALGKVTVDDIKTNDVTLVNLLFDDSWSIEQAGNTQTVVKGHNSILHALRESKAVGTTLIGCQYLNHGSLYSFVRLDGATEMFDRPDGKGNKQNYFPDGGTPLCDMSAVILASTTAKMAELEQGGITVRCVTFIITDGEDLHSRRHNPASIRPIVEGMLATESHIVGAMGIDDGHTDFRKVFGAMGIQDRWILTPGNTESEIRHAFGTISQSAVEVSQAAGASFSKVGLGGFGN